MRFDPVTGRRPPLQPCCRIAVVFLGAVACGAAGPVAAQLQCRGGSVEYYPGGGIERCVIEGNHRLFTAAGDAVHCATGHMLEQHLNGELKSCVIERAQRVDGADCGTGRVDLEPDGRLRACGKPQ